MTKERKDALRRKGGIVAWTCQDREDLPHLCWVKAKASKFYLMKETLEGDVAIGPHGPGPYMLDRRWKLPILIRSFRDYLVQINVSVSWPIYLKDMDKVRTMPPIRARILREVQ